MAEDSKIQWTHHTLNPWSGCQKAHPGCLNCYAEAMPPSMRRHAKWGTAAQGGQRVPASDEYMRQPYAWVRKAAKAGERHRVFCGSACDVLEVTGSLTLDAIMGAQRSKLWPIIRDTAYVPVPRDEEEPAGVHAGCPPPRVHPGLDYLLLTKRPENAHLVPEDVRPLVALGTSISNQPTADLYVPRLLEAAGFRLRFLSVEPLVGPVDLSEWIERIDHCSDCGAENPPQKDDDCPECHHGGTLISTWGYAQAERYRSGERYTTEAGQRDVDGTAPRIDWVIVGGESGHGARECREEDVRSIVQQCRQAGVRCFVKQMGRRWAEARGLMEERTNNGVTKLVPDTHGGRPETWPEDLRVQEFPHA